MIVTYHAKIKYMREMARRGSGEINLEDAEVAIQKLFEQAILEEETAGLIKRKIDNKFEDAIYYRVGIWRIVVCNETIVTIEIDTFKFTGMGYIPKQSLYKRRKNKHERSKSKAVEK